MVTSSFRRAGLHSIWVKAAYPLAIEVVVIVALEDFLHGLFVLEDDEAEAAGSHGLVVVDDVGLNDFAKLLEVSLQDFVVDGQRESSDEDFALLFSG